MSQVSLSPETEPHGEPHGGETPAEQTPPQGVPLALQALLAVIACVAFAYFFPSGAKATAIFVVTLSILVFVHEWGHFQFARWAGMKVNRFAIGFPPFIYTKRVKGVNYSIGALPIGGMVDIAGLGSEEEMVHTATGEAATPVKDLARPYGEKQFQDANLGWRFLTLFAGPLMNFVFAIVLVVGLLSIVGQPDLTNAKLNRVGMTLNGSPAAKAGVQANDLIVGVNGTKTREFEKITELIRQSNGAPVTLNLDRNGQMLDLKIQPELKKIETKKDVFETVPTVGISFDYDPKTYGPYQRVGVIDATQTAFYGAYGMSSQILNLVKRAVSFKLTDTDKSGVGGPVAIAKMASSSSDAGLYQMVMFAASLSINLGLLNLLPFPALDGGRILFLGYELIMRRPLDPRKEGLVHAAGMVLLLAFMLFITLRDVMPMISR